MAMMRALLSVAFVLGACGDDMSAAPDAQVPQSDAGTITDFFGETCTETIYMGQPIITYCHDREGACDDGTCRPWCDTRADDGYGACSAGKRVITDRGACVCAPD